MECALVVVYLRDPSFEVHGSLPHRYANMNIIFKNFNNVIV